MRAALYARVSSSKQEQERTIASQVEAVESYAASHGYELVSTARFCDDGFSGARLDRPGLDALRDGARASAFQAVLVLDPDRLARHYAYQVLIIEELQRFGVSVVFLQQPPLDDPAARLLVQIQGAVAEYERAKIAERNRRGRQFRLRQGEVAIGVAPYGYRRVPRTSAEPAHLIVHEPEAAVVRQIFAWHANEEGMSLYQIAARLDNRGIPTAHGAAHWSPQAVRVILRNSVYTGAWVVNRQRPAEDPAARRRVPRPENEWITLSVPSLVDRDTFLRSQQRHAHNAHYSPRHSKQSGWLLQGLVRCGLCHHACVTRRGGARRAGQGYHHYYRCGNTKREAVARCPAPAVRAPELDALVWSEVTRTLCDPHALQQAVAGGATVSADSNVLAAQRVALERHLHAAEQERQRLLDAYQAGVVSLPELQPRLAALELRREQWQDEHDRLERAQRDAAAAQELLGRLDNLARSIQERLAHMDFVQQQALLREVLERVEVTPAEVRLHYRIPLPPGPTTPGPDPSTELRLRQDSRDGVRASVQIEPRGIEPPLEAAMPRRKPWPEPLDLELLHHQLAIAQVGRTRARDGGGGRREPRPIEAGDQRPVCAQSVLVPTPGAHRPMEARKRSVSARVSRYAHPSPRPKLKKPCSWPSKGTSSQRLPSSRIRSQNVIACENGTAVSAVPWKMITGGAPGAT